MKNFLKSLVYAVALTFVISLIFATYYLIIYGNLDVSFFQSRGALNGMSHGVMLYLANGYLASYVHKCVPDDRQWQKRLSYFIPSSILVTISIVFVINYSFQVLWGGVSFSVFLANQTPGMYILTTALALFIGLGFYAFYFYKAAKNAQIQQQKQIAGHATAQFESLKNQIDPHFLFNSLNVLTGLIEENPQKAVDFTTSLSRIYRYVLEQKDKSLVPAEQEIKFALIFLNLLGLRFEDALLVQVDDSNVKSEESIIPLSLQLLIENAIKHNVLSPDSRLHIHIFKKGSHLYVRNNLQIKDTLGESTGVGLKNIIDRYRLITSQELIIHHHADYFEVGLPLLTIESEL
jgi:two-component system LytT family sensor kinase